MQNIGKFSAQTCGGVSRRSFLTAAGTLPFALTTGGAFAAPRHQRAKSVLLIWLWGAPSHLDTFDPKPAAPLDHRGPFAPIATQLPGVQFSELLPRLAARNRQFTLIRSNKTFDGGHPGAGTWGLTGFAENPEPVHPNFGSIVGKARMQGGESTGKLPPFFAIGRGIPRDLPRQIKGYGGGKLGRVYDPFLVSCTHRGDVKLPALDLLDDLNPKRIGDRRRLLTSLDSAARSLDGVGIDGWQRNFQLAYGFLTEPAARQAFDLTRESDTTRATYGKTTFGQSCLLARRLVEAEVPYVQVNWSEYVEAMSPGCDFGWDTHIYNFELLQDRHCPIFDRAMSALLDDLHTRGLLDSTLVVAMGEFGRTPKINQRAARDHWPRCYFSMWAGAGIEPGRVIGESDKLGNDPVTEPVTPVMVGTTIAELAGIDTQARAEMGVLPDGKAIHELI